MTSKDMDISKIKIVGKRTDDTMPLYLLRSIQMLSHWPAVKSAFAPHNHVRALNPEPACFRIAESRKSLGYALWDTKTPIIVMVDRR